MDAERFDTLMRGLQRTAGSRRGLLRALSAAALGTAAPLLCLTGSGAKKKKKKKKNKSSSPSRFAPSQPSQPSAPPAACHGAQGTCAGGCCNGLTCADNFCVPGPVCCGEAGATCTYDCDCCGSETCNGGVCGGHGQTCSSGRDVECGDSGASCCNTGTETCAWAAETCLSGVCPVATDYCTDPETYYCSDDCRCMTTLAGATVCTPLPDTIIPCSNNQNCAPLGPNGGVCVPCDQTYCSDFCQPWQTGFCVPGVCLDLPSGLTGASAVPPKKDNSAATSGDAKRARTEHATSKQEARRRSNKRKRH